jgi:hypothetical protein
MQKKVPKVLAAMLGVAMVVSGAAPARAQVKQTEAGMPKLGDMAPDFNMKYFDGSELKDVSLSQYRGKKNVVVAFFIFAFTGG